MYVSGKHQNTEGGLQCSQCIFSMYTPSSLVSDPNANVRVWYHVNAPAQSTCLDAKCHCFNGNAFFPLSVSTCWSCLNTHTKKSSRTGSSWRCTVEAMVIQWPDEVDNWCAIQSGRSYVAIRQYEGVWGCWLAEQPWCRCPQAGLTFTSCKGHPHQHIPSLVQDAVP